GERLLAELRRLPGRGVAVRVAVSAPSPAAPLDDLRALERSGERAGGAPRIRDPRIRVGVFGGGSRGAAAGAAVRVVELPRLTGGVLHTKFWLVDGVHLYIGSANMDWRALTQVGRAGGAGKPHPGGAEPNGVGVETNGWCQTQRGWCQTQCGWCQTQRGWCGNQ
ncbi:hypothetical protein DV515_00019235, partial [Chloebia gouldiae]